MTYQKDDESDLDYFKNFKACCEVVDTFGGKTGYHQAVYTRYLQKTATKLSVAMDDVPEAEKEKCVEASCNEYKATLFLKLANGMGRGAQASRQIVEEPVPLQSGSVPQDC
jgi:hypothetical protein